MLESVPFRSTATAIEEALVPDISSNLKWVSVATLRNNAPTAYPTVPGAPRRDLALPPAVTRTARAAFFAAPKRLECELARPGEVGAAGVVAPVRRFAVRPRQAAPRAIEEHAATHGDVAQQIAARTECR